MNSYTIQQVNGELVVVSTDNNMFPLSTLNKFKLTTDQTKIGTRIYDEKWEMWVITIVDLKEGSDVTVFMTK